MTTRLLSSIRAAAAVALLLLLAATSLIAATASYSFRNGTNGYDAAADVSITDQYAQYNGGNGTTTRGAELMGCYNTTGGDAYSARYLLKFGGLTFPPKSKVVSATLTLSVEWWNGSPGSFTGLYLKNTWNAAASQLGWLHRDIGADWSAPGASASGVDTVAGKSFSLPLLTASGLQTVSAPLDPAVVQSWLDTPASNQGILLVNNNAAEIARIAGTTAPLAQRPQLTLVVTTPAGVQILLNPPSATIAPGRTQSFAASVWGSQNSSVSWSATGGTITQAGDYTAGSVAGTFKVKAIPAADPTKAASATITIANVLLSVTPAALTLAPDGAQQFTANVTGTPNTAVMWTASGGTITPGGLFTAGSTTGSFTVTATSAADPSKSTSASVVISQEVSVSVSPQTATVEAGEAAQFTATVSGATNSAVTWSATGGTITSSGLYTAGTLTGSFSVTARSVQDTSKTSSASVTVIPSHTVAVSVSPATALLYPATTLQFSATVLNALDTAVTWTSSGGQISPTGLFTAPGNAGTFTVTAASVHDPARKATATVTVTAPNNNAHPRIILDQPLLTTLRARALASTYEWTSLKAECDSFLGGGTVYLPGQNGYPNRPSVGEGYQGSGYVDALLPLSLCYQTVRATAPALAAQYGAKSAAILAAMSDPTGFTVNGTPVWRRDDGYGVRNFAFGMGIGYDWVYDVLTPAQKAQIHTALQNWIEGYETWGFERGQPQGNYFAGYYIGKVMAALAIEGDNHLGEAWWEDWYIHQHQQLVAPSFALNLAGGGWSEGLAQYGFLSMLNHTLPVLAVKSAKGIDLVNAPQPYRYPLESAKYLMHFTWPTRNMVDERGDIYNTDSVEIWPGTPSVYPYRMFAGFLSLWGDPLAPLMHRYARDVKASLDALNAGQTVRWIDFLFWDEMALEADYSTLQASYLAPGTGGVSARSDWSSGASFLTFVAGPYVNYPGASHEHFDKGSPAIERAKNPLLVNPTAWITHEPYGSPGWTATFDDIFGNANVNEAYGNRRLYNTFQVRKTDASGASVNPYGQWQALRSYGTRTQVSRFEDGGSYVLAVGDFLQDMYRPLASVCGGGPAMTAWSRQILYLRPSQFVIYDRTGVCDSSLDQFLAFHFAANPIEVNAPATGVRRFDVMTPAFAGSMTTILPANASVATTDNVSPDSRLLNKLWRTEVRPTDAAAVTRRWLSVFDTASSPADIAAATPLTITSGPAIGVVLQSSGGNTVAVFGTAHAGTAISGSLGYTAPAVQARHVITDLVPSTGYSVSVTAGANGHAVTVTQGGPLQSTAAGALTFGVTGGGVVLP